MVLMTAWLSGGEHETEADVAALQDTVQCSAVPSGSSTLGRWQTEGKTRMDHQSDQGRRSP